MDLQIAVASFCSITNSSAEDAIRYLEMANNDVNLAVTLYFDNPPSDHENPQQDAMMEEDIPQEGEYRRIYESTGTVLFYVVRSCV